MRRLMQPIYARLIQGLIVGASMIALPALAQEPPLPKVIKLIVPFAPGGSNDVYARALAQKLSTKLGVTMVVENKAGAGGSIGSDLVSKSEPDGSTLLLISTSIATNAAVRPNLPFDPVTSFQPVALVAKGAMVLIVGSKTPYMNLQQLLDATKDKNNKVNYSSAGIGSIGQLSVEYLKAISGTQALHVPYQGIAASLINMIGGNIDYMITTLASVGGQIKSGQVRPIAVTSLEKSKFLPDVPPAAQLMPGYEVDVWWVVFAPAKTPDAIVNRLNQAIRDVSQDADMQELFAKEGAEPMPYSPAQTAAYVKTEVEKWRKVARDANIQANN